MLRPLNMPKSRKLRINPQPMVAMVNDRKRASPRRINLHQASPNARQRSQLLYCTDYPFRDGAEVNESIANFGFAPADVRSIERGVAQRV